MRLKKVFFFNCPKNIFHLINLSSASLASIIIIIIIATAEDFFFLLWNFNFKTLKPQKQQTINVA